MSGFGSTTPMIESGNFMILDGEDYRNLLLPAYTQGDPTLRPIVTLAPYDSTGLETGEMDLNPYVGSDAYWDDGHQKWVVRIWRGANLPDEGTKIFWKAVFLKHPREIGPTPTLVSEP